MLFLYFYLKKRIFFCICYIVINDARYFPCFIIFARDFSSQLVVCVCACVFTFDCEQFLRISKILIISDIKYNVHFLICLTHRSRVQMFHGTVDMCALDLFASIRIVMRSIRTSYTEFIQIGLSSSVCSKIQSIYIVENLRIFCSKF